MRASASPSERPLLVATDLDGCLLDDAYGFEPARPALTLMAARGVPLLLASSKTRAEMEPLARSQQIVTGLIVENGGELLVPVGTMARPPSGASLVGDYWTIALGEPRRALLPALEEIGRDAGTSIRSFAAMDPDEVARLTGLGPASARLALEREYDEPYLVEDESRAAAVATAARARGLQVTRGGRFWHLSAGGDKGRALRAFLEVHAAEGRRFFVVGLGDAPNDLPLLRVADRPIVLPQVHGLDPVLCSELPRAERAPGPGPVGWNAALMTVLGGGRLPTLSEEGA